MNIQDYSQRQRQEPLRDKSIRHLGCFRLNKQIYLEFMFCPLHCFNTAKTSMKLNIVFYLSGTRNQSNIGLYMWIIFMAMDQGCLKMKIYVEKVMNFYEPTHI